MRVSKNFHFKPFLWFTPKNRLLTPQRPTSNVPTSRWRNPWRPTRRWPPSPRPSRRHRRRKWKQTWMRPLGRDGDGRITLYIADCWWWFFGFEQMNCFFFFLIAGFIIIILYTSVLLLLFIYIYIVGARMGMTVVGDDLIDGVQYNYIICSSW